MSKPGIPTPIRRAQKGKPPTVEWAKWVEDEIRKLQSTGTPPLRQIASASGKEPFWTTISRVANSDPAEYQVTVTTGFLCYQNATLTDADSGVVGYLTPKIRTADGELVSIESTGEPGWVAPALPLEGLVNYIYLRVKTDSDGAPKEPTPPEFPGDPGASDGPTIEAFTEPQLSTHHVRDNPSSGEEEGDYFFLICETESNEATTPAPRVVRRITGNRELPNQLIEITNIEEDNEDGEVRELYEGYEVGPTDKHQFRTLVQIEGEGEPVIKPMEDPDNPPRSVRFKLVKPNNSQGPQVNVSSQDNGDTIQIEGNGQSIDYTDPFGGGLMFQDGLVILKKEPEKGVEGKNLNLTVQPLEWLIGGGAAEMIFLSYPSPIVHYWRKGIYIGTTDPMDAPAGLIEQTVTEMRETS